MNQDKKCKAKLFSNPVVVNWYNDNELSGLYVPFQLSRRNLDLMNKLNDNGTAELFYKSYN